MRAAVVVPGPAITGLADPCRRSERAGHRRRSRVVPRGDPSSLPRGFFLPVIRALRMTARRACHDDAQATIDDLRLRRRALAELDAAAPLDVHAPGSARISAPKGELTALPARSRLRSRPTSGRRRPGRQRRSRRADRRLRSARSRRSPPPISSSAWPSEAVDVTLPGRAADRSAPSTRSRR